MRAIDIGKALLDRGYHAPTVYFPLLVPECIMIEPTETESKETLDGFIAALREILIAAREAPQSVLDAPVTTAGRSRGRNARGPLPRPSVAVILSLSKDRRAHKEGIPARLVGSANSFLGGGRILGEDHSGTERIGSDADQV